MYLLNKPIFPQIRSGMLLRSQKTSDELDFSETRHPSHERTNRELEAEIARGSVGIVAEGTMNATNLSMQKGQVRSSGGRGDGVEEHSFLENNANHNQGINGRGCREQRNAAVPELVMPRNTFRLDEIAAFLPFFAGEKDEDVAHFISIIENTKRALEIDDQTMKLVLIKQLKGNARVWLHSRADFMLRTFAETLEDLRQMFGSVESGFELRKRLEQIRWFGLLE